MKKNIILFTSLVAALCACNKQELTPLEPENTSSKQIITATVNVATKVAYSENDPSNKNSGLGSVWKYGDTFLAIQKTGSDPEKVVEFTLKSGAESSSAIFETETEGVTAETQWLAVLGKKASAHGGNTKEIHCGFLDQKGTLSDLDKYNYVTAMGSGVEPSFDFNKGNHLSYILRVKLPANIKTIEYVPCDYFKVMSESTTAIHTKGEEDDYSKNTTTTITLDSPSNAGDVVYIAVPAVDNGYYFNKTYVGSTQAGNLRTGVIITILNNTSSLADESNGIVISEDFREKGGMIGTIDMSSIELIKRPMPSQAILFNSTGVADISWSSGNLKESYSTVNTYWAPFNVGANKPSDVGGYYAWGDIRTRTNYTYVTYSPLRGGASDPFNCCNYISVHIESPSGNNYYTITGGRYDVARVKWGKAWRMPHCIEANALRTKHTSDFSTVEVDGVTCMMVSNADENGPLYVPFGGWYNDNTKNYGYLNANNGNSTTTFATANFWTGDQAGRARGSNETQVSYQRAYVFHYPLADGGTTCDLDKNPRIAGVPVRAVLASSVLKQATE